MKTLQIHQTCRNTILHSLQCIIMLYYFILRKVILLPAAWSNYCVSLSFLLILLLITKKLKLTFLCGLLSKIVRKVRTNYAR